MFNTKELISTKSNILSFLRLLMAIPFWFLLNNISSSSTRVIVICMCIIAAITDILDGYLARKFNEVTESGKIIDPLADKIVIGVIVIKLFLLNQIPDYYFWMIIGRDVIIFLGGIYVSKKLGKVLPSNMLGKITVISISLVLLLVLFQVNQQSMIFMEIFYLSILLILGSLIGYTIRAVEFIKQKEHEPV